MGLAQSGAEGPAAFRYMRKVLGLKGVELAKMLETTPETVSRWEHSKHPIDVKAVRLLASMVLQELGTPGFTLRQYLQELGTERLGGVTTTKKRVASG